MGQRGSHGGICACSVDGQGVLPEGFPAVGSSEPVALGWLHSVLRLGDCGDRDAAGTGSAPCCVPALPARGCWDPLVLPCSTKCGLSAFKICVNSV